jgi:hypothetical protein
MSSLTTDQKVDKLIEFLEKIHGPNIIGDKPEPQPPVTKPAEGSYVIKPGGWGAVDNPNAWKITNMRDYPELFKIVDPTDRNVATNFVAEQLAQSYIDYYKSQWKEELEPDEGQEKPPEEKPEPPAEGTTVKGPYPAVGKELKSTQRGPTTRHYASGKPDDQTIEKNVKGIKARKHQFIVFVKMNKVEHDDQVSTKLGGTHMGTGWFDNTIEFSGQCCLGVERKHPSTKLCVKKGPNIGSVLGKKLGMCSVYDADKNHVELWVDLEKGKWEKVLEGDNVDGFNPKAKEFECQLRIDGWKDEPQIDTAVVQEIA